MDTKKIGKFLKELRVKKNLTQEEVGDLLSLSSKTISRWETGMGTPDLFTITEVAKLYEVSVDEILAGEKNDNIEDKEKNKFSLPVNLILFLIFLILSLFFGLFFGRIVAIIVEILGFAGITCFYILSKGKSKSKNQEVNYDQIFIDISFSYIILAEVLSFFYTEYSIYYSQQKIIFLIFAFVSYLIVRLKSPILSSFQNKKTQKRIEIATYIFMLYTFLFLFGLIHRTFDSTSYKFSYDYFPSTFFIIFINENEEKYVILYKIIYLLIFSSSSIINYFAIRKRNIIFFVFSAVLGIFSSFFIFFKNSFGDFNILGLISCIISFLLFVLLRKYSKNIC